MKASIKLNGSIVTVDLSRNYDLSIPLQASEENPLVWGVDQPIIKPVQKGGWIGKVTEGASVNFNSIQFSPHGHGTHTECVGHITPEFHSINQLLKEFVFCAEVISVVPENFGDDYRISKKQLVSALKDARPTALIIRTLPNTERKTKRNYTGTNWAYLEESAAAHLAEINVKHLLIDLPSVDKEDDGGGLLAHKAFWNYPEAPRYDCTITELIFVPNEVEDGPYLLNLLIAPFESDASPSKPILYPFMKKSDK